MGLEAGTSDARRVATKRSRACVLLFLRAHMPRPDTRRLHGNQKWFGALGPVRAHSPWAVWGP